MTNKPKLNQPDVEITTTFNDINLPESLNVNINIPSDMLKDFISQQSIVDFKRDHVELNLREYGKMKIERDVIIYNNKVFMYAQKLTLDECIKEWVERGWTVDELKQFPVIKIWKLNQEQCVVYNIYIFNKTLTSKIDFDADYETLNLLTKTLKALEEMKNE